MNKKRILKEYVLIVLGSAIYALSTVLFIFPLSLLLGGTSGISVILSSLMKSSPGIILTVINGALLVLALVILGKSMALKTFVGSTATTLFVYLFEAVIKMDSPLISNHFLGACVGALLIALASAIMFFIDSSSGGTDIIALIIKKFSQIEIGKALLITDVLIVVVGGILSGWVIAIASFIGLLIKTLGIDLIIKIFRLSERTKK